MEILHYGYMNRALLAGVTAGIICPVVGIFIVLRRMSLIADALSHLSLAGVAAGLLTGIHPVISASVFSILGAVFIEKIRETYRHYSELSIAIMLSTGLALGAVLLGLGNGFNASALGYLFGSIVAVGESDVYAIAAVGLFVLAAITLLFKELYYITFDEEAARASGLPVSAINIGFTILTSLTIAVTMRILGILLVSSLMILPVASALQLAGSFKQALHLSVLFGLFSVFAGLFASFYLDLAPGGAIVLISVTLLLLALAGKKALAGQERRIKDQGESNVF